MTGIIIAASLGVGFDIAALIGLFGVAVGLRRRKLAARLAASGYRTTGTVVHVGSEEFEGDGNPHTLLTETIEFPTLHGGPVRGNPSFSDVGHVNRQGHAVTVFYDRERPDVFLAPLNGREMSGASTSRILFGSSIAAVVGIIGTAACIAIIVHLM